METLRANGYLKDARRDLLFKRLATVIAAVSEKPFGPNAEALSEHLSKMAHDVLWGNEAPSRKTAAQFVERPTPNTVSRSSPPSPAASDCKSAREPNTDEVLEWARTAEELVRKGYTKQVASFAPSDNLWLYRASTADSTQVASWVGSTESGKSIVASRKVPRHVAQFCDLIVNDIPFRRALIALPDALEDLRRLLGLPDRHMWHTCMMALLNERSSQRKQGPGVVLYVSENFCQYSRIEDHLGDINSYLKAWCEDFFKHFPPK